MMFVDTNIVSELIRPRPHPAVLAWAQRCERFALSVVTIEELRFGLSLRPSARIERWLRGFVEEYCDVLPVTHSIAEWCGTTRAALRLQGQPRTQADLLIAGTAFACGLPLVTRNVRDFQGCGLHVINPFDGGQLLTPVSARKPSRSAGQERRRAFTHRATRALRWAVYEPIPGSISSVLGRADWKASG